MSRFLPSSTFPSRSFSYFVQTSALVAALIATALLVSALLFGSLGLLTALALLLLTFLLRHHGERFWRLRGASEIGPRSATHWSRSLYFAVEQLATRAELSAPRVYLLPTSAPNAVATETRDGRGAIALTTGLLSLLTPREVVGVVAHEISHLRHGDLRLKRLTSIASGIALNLLRIAMWLGFILALVSGEWEQWLLLLVLNLVLPRLFLSLEARLSRTREFAADEGAARLTGDPRALASALVKLERVSSGAFGWLKPIRTVIDEYSSHPATEDRAARLLEMAEADASQGADVGEVSRRHHEQRFDRRLTGGYDTRWHRLAPW